MATDYWGEELEKELASSKGSALILPAESIDYVGIAESGAYTAIPIETLDRVWELLDDARGKLYVGRTEQTMRVLDEIKKELFEEDRDGD